MGDLVQDRIFSLNQTGRKVTEDFGVLINSKNIDEHQSSQKMKQQEYMENYLGDIKELTKRVNDIKKNIRPFDCTRN